jgi:L-aspartate oxidase
MSGIVSLSHRPVIIGTGLAGLAAALALAPMPVVLLSTAKLGEETSSILAQGGLAAAIGPGDRPALHAEDTIKAGAGLCDPNIVRLVTEDAASILENLCALGAAFDRDNAGRLQFGLEGAHGQRRVVHGAGDGTGRVIMQALIRAASATPSIEMIENAIATNLLTDGNGIAGVAFARDGEQQMIATDRVVLATGGAGALWLHTTNPRGSWGHGLALAARAGAALADLEFMQFHPTAIDIDRDPMPLASEALRGEGAMLIDETGTHFMNYFPRAELEPRDVVARALTKRMAEGHKIFLDGRALENFAARFPGIYASCHEAGIDPATMAIPVRPAAHYHMGGAATDAKGRSSVAGLWACGEVASTGLHGANRLASNSLLEAASFGRRVAQDIKNVAPRKIRAPALPKTRAPETDAIRKTIRETMSAHLGVMRDGKGLKTAIDRLAPLADRSDMALAGFMIATAALVREESRGSHNRADFPNTSAALARRVVFTLDELTRFAQASDDIHSRPAYAGT